ncbi:hypothetical protein L3Y34_002371 [Caenorhabditis briggsae]|uniref:Uncharacterized protein n=2 Tax=Caenorhabditis briggsae TaxID=6238 RepID=A0AAE9DG00_CAEBR|nr:hypothetical protein L3Y34_002371 [Caenorhabditis briggsae]
MPSSSSLNKRKILFILFSYYLTFQTFSFIFTSELWMVIVFHALASFHFALMSYMAGNTQATLSVFYFTEFTLLFSSLIWSGFVLGLRFYVKSAEIQRSDEYSIYANFIGILIHFIIFHCYQSRVMKMEQEENGNRFEPLVVYDATATDEEEY